MPVATPYALPFGVLVPADGELASGARFSLVVTMQQPSADAIEALSSVLTSWEVLASVGAMSGARIPASESSIANVSDPMTGADSMAWVLDGVRLDDRATVILANLFLSEWEEHRFARVDLYRSDDPTSANPLRYAEDERHPYPDRDQRILFHVDLSSEVMEDVAIEITFADVLTDEQVDSIRESLTTWAGVTACGAYAMAPLPPEKCGVVFDLDDIEVIDATLTWSLRKFTAHSGALDGLANTVAAIDQTTVPVRELRVR